MTDMEIADQLEELFGKAGSEHHKALTQIDNLK